MTPENMKIDDIIKKCCFTLFEKQPKLLSKNFDVNERTISAELSNVISQYFNDYEVNCEYNRMTDENGLQIPKRIILDEGNINPELVYPDIIVHRQEDSEHNLLVIELKINWKSDKKNFDYEKLKAFTSQLNYKYGLYLELGENIITEMSWFVQGKEL